MLFPAHTTHVIQPLDVGIFNIYKAAYRNRNTTHAVMPVSQISGLAKATKKRCIMLAKSLVAYRLISEQNIISAFRNTGLYPFSFESFLVYNKSIQDVPEEALSRAHTTVQARLDEWCDSVVSSKRKRLSSGVLLVNTSGDSEPIETNDDSSCLV